MLADTGPQWSIKHQAPISERCRCGSVRRTRIALGPPSATSRGCSTSVSATRLALHSTSAGAASRLLMSWPFVVGNIVGADSPGGSAPRAGHVPYCGVEQLGHDGELGPVARWLDVDVGAGKLW